VTTLPLTSPFDDRDIDEPHLERAPLIRVLAQVRHPALAAFMGDTGQETASRLGKKLSAEYPFVEQRSETELVFTPQQITEKQSAAAIWRLRSRDEQWQLSFGQQFVSLDTSDYRNRDDFCARLEDALTIYSEVVNPGTSLRVGIRYMNRIDDPRLIETLPSLVRPEVVGPVSVPLPSTVHLEHSLTQVLHVVGDGGIQAQWGIVPPNAVLDASVPATDLRSWVLDLDSFSAKRSKFDARAITARVRDLANRAYRYFRWAVTEEFIAEFRELR
jgi:uncharacterized protein (TIGR04255 family)